MRSTPPLIRSGRQSWGRFLHLGAHGHNRARNTIAGSRLQRRSGDRAGRKSVIASGHYEPMAEPIKPRPRRRIEMPLPEARTRLAQIVPLASVTGQVTVITDRGRPVAAIVPINAVPSEQPALSATARSENAAAGWMRRIEQVRDAVRRQHAMRITGLERALIDVWAVIDRLLPQGSDTTVDELRIVHRDVLAMPPPAIEPPAQPS